MQAADHRGKCDPARGVSLRVEEHLDMPDIVGVRALQISPGEIVEILLGDQHRHALIVDVEEILQVAKLIRLAQRLDRGIGQPDAIAARQGEHQFRLQAALDVDVQLAFRQPFDQ